MYTFITKLWQRLENVLLAVKRHSVVNLWRLRRPMKLTVPNVSMVSSTHKQQRGEGGQTARETRQEEIHYFWGGVLEVFGGKFRQEVLEKVTQGRMWIKIVFLHPPTPPHPPTRPPRPPPKKKWECYNMKKHKPILCSFITKYSATINIAFLFTLLLDLGGWHFGNDYRPRLVLSCPFNTCWEVCGVTLVLSLLSMPHCQSSCLGQQKAPEM